MGQLAESVSQHNIFPLEIQRFSQNMKTATFLLPTVFLLAFVILPSYTQKDLAESRQRRAADCESKTCLDCRGSCDGCDKCPLCRIVQAACDRGRKKLTLGGVDICDSCKYCKNGKDECKRKCILGKQEGVCLQCIKQCPKL